jgi:UDP-N-acetylmuramoylalanine--D-glutamate ligase
MLQASGRRVLVGGNIGVPLSAQVDGSTPETLHVVEASSFQLETTDTFHPWIAAVLNFSPDHLDRHPGIEAYAAAKAAIFANQHPDDWAVVNADDEGARSLASGARARRAWFGTTTSPRGHGRRRARRRADRARRARAGADERDTRARPPHPERRAGGHGREPARGRHGRGGRRGRVDLHRSRARDGERGRDRRRAVRERLEGDQRRRRPLRRRERRGGLVAIMGGRFKGGNLADLRAPLRARARAVVAIGEAAPLVADAFAGAVPVHAARTLDEAVASRSSWRSRTAPSCSRRRARASTCSRVMPTAVGSSRRPWRGWPAHAGPPSSREQSSVGCARSRVGRWERRLPRPARLVSRPDRLMTADDSTARTACTLS